MTTVTTTNPGTGAVKGIRAAGAESVRRVAALARAEALLLRRNPMALITALASPIILVLFTRLSVPSDGTDKHGAGAVIVMSLTAFTLLFVVYYNLVTALTARREELVLKRLRSGPCSDAEILAGTAAPAVALAWTQIVIGLVAVLSIVDRRIPANPLVVLVGVLLGTAVFVMGAAATTVVTRTVEMAQLTTSPMVIVSMLLSGVAIPLADLPDSVERVAHLLPLAAVVDLLNLGLSGSTSAGRTVGLTGSFTGAVMPILILSAWLVAAGWVVRARFRWEPRR